MLFFCILFTMAHRTTVSSTGYVLETNEMSVNFFLKFIGILYLQYYIIVNSTVPVELRVEVVLYVFVLCTGMWKFMNKRGGNNSYIICCYLLT